MITVTRKIQLNFVLDDAAKPAQRKKQLKEFYEKIYGWQRICHHAANWVASTLFIQDSIKGMFYLTEGIKYKLANMNADPNGILTTSKTNSTYQLLSERYKGQCPMGMLSGLNTVICKTYAEEARDVRNGLKSLRSYRRDIPMPMRSADITTINKLPKGHEYAGNYEFYVYGTMFRTYFGRDRSDNESFFDKSIIPVWLFDLQLLLSDIIKEHATGVFEESFEGSIGGIDFNFQLNLNDPDNPYFNVQASGERDFKFKMAWPADKKKNKQDEQAAESSTTKNGEEKNWMIKPVYKLCDSSIQIQDNKIFLLAVFSFDEEKRDLDPEKICYAELDVNIPIKCFINAKEFTIGSSREFLHRRTRIQAALKSTQESSRFNKCGKGREKKMQATERYKKLEHNYVETRIHQYTHKLISICLKHGCGKLVLRNQEAKEEEAKTDIEFLLRNWSYYSMKDKISYKAKKIGLEVEVEKIETQESATAE